MKLDYNIAWFEDSTSYVASNIRKLDKLNKFLIEKGFNLNVTFFHKDNLETPQSNLIKTKAYIKMEQVANYLGTTLTSKKKDIRNTDLILVDYNLGGRLQDGDSIIGFIRDEINDIYTEVIFYSTALSEEELRGKIQRDGLYCSKRGDLLSGKGKLINIINLTIKKTQDLNNLRGLVMAETSELDEIVRDILIAVVKNNNLSLKAECKCNKCSCVTCVKGTCSPCSSCKKKVIDYIDNGSNIIFSLCKYTTKPKALNNAKSSELLNGISGFLISSLNNTGATETDIDDYKKEVKYYRDLLAHTKEKLSTSDKISVIKQDGTFEEFDEVKFNKIRKNIRKYKLVFENIKTSL